MLLGFSAFVEGASRHNLALLHDAERLRQTNGARAPLLDANHPDVLRNILSTVVHEVGHTLGLRHNFIAQEDGNTSVMAYSDDLDTTSFGHDDDGSGVIAGRKRCDSSDLFRFSWIFFWICQPPDPSLSRRSL